MIFVVAESEMKVKRIISSQVLQIDSNIKKLIKKNSLIAFYKSANVMKNHIQRNQYTIKKHDQSLTIFLNNKLIETRQKIESLKDFF